EVTDYTRLFSEAREVAISRMIENAISVGADAVVNVRLVSSMISQGMSELLAYGTAVKLDKEKNEANK
ncbi:MAG TPA: heavy metal-binding domain-containing protein, partial [Deltaproteobacteria bacterium]|nr:heavy metal-binding domain-containing protein [Deltaproteobacteria bacterium]